MQPSPIRNPTRDLITVPARGSRRLGKSRSPHRVRWIQCDRGSPRARRVRRDGQRLRRPNQNPIQALAASRPAITPPLERFQRWCFRQPGRRGPPYDGLRNQNRAVDRVPHDRDAGATLGDGCDHGAAAGAAEQRHSMSVCAGSRCCAPCNACGATNASPLGGWIVWTAEHPAMIDGGLIRPFTPRLPLS